MSCPVISLARSCIWYCSRLPAGCAEGEPAIDEPQQGGGKGWCPCRCLENFCDRCPSWMAPGCVRTNLLVVMFPQAVVIDTSVRSPPRCRVAVPSCGAELRCRFGGAIQRGHPVWLCYRYRSGPCCGGWPRGVGWGLIQRASGPAYQSLRCASRHVTIRYD